MTLFELYLSIFPPGQRFCFVENIAAHVYLIPVERKEDWAAYTHRYYENDTDELPPDWSFCVTDSTRLSFTFPEPVEGQNWENAR